MTLAEELDRAGDKYFEILYYCNDPIILGMALKNLHSPFRDMIQHDGELRIREIYKGRRND